MNFQKLELHISQIEKVISGCNKRFTESKKQEIYNNLIDIFNSIKKSNYRSFNSENLGYTKGILDIIFYGIEYLNNDLKDVISEQFIYCLNDVLREWIPKNADDFYIVVSPNNSPYEFAAIGFAEEDVQAITAYIKLVFNVDYKQLLIQISKPRFLYDDYMGMVPIYHELGHFIEMNYNITKRLLRNKSFLMGLSPEDRNIKIMCHYTEHFCDIFGAQYIGESILEPLDYHSFGAQHNSTHPSTESRIKVVKAFLSGAGDPDSIEIVNALKKETSANPKIELKIRNIPLTKNPFTSLKPEKMDKKEMFHSLITEGWNNWIDIKSPIRVKYSDSLKCCNEINNLISESIKLSII